MATTTNFNLTKPSDTEAPDIVPINENMDKIDTQIKVAQDQVELGSDITE